MTHADIWQAIENVANANNMSCSCLAKKSGLDAGAFNKSKRWTKEGKPIWPSVQSLAKVMSFAGLTPLEFAKYIPNNERPAI